MQPGHGKALPVSFFTLKVGRFAEGLAIKFSWLWTNQRHLERKQKATSIERRDQGFERFRRAGRRNLSLDVYGAPNDRQRPHMLAARDAGPVRRSKARATASPREAHRVSFARLRSHRTDKGADVAGADQAAIFCGGTCTLAVRKMQ